MSMKIITGSTGTTHVTSNNDGEFNQAIWGNGLVVLSNGNKLAATVADNNTITIADGDLVLQGRHALLEPGTTEDVTIETGTVGMNRNDLIVAHYEINQSTGYESITLEVIKGTETSGTATDPEYTTGTIRTGSTVVEAPLYRVSLNGISIDSVTALFDVVENVNDRLDALEGMFYTEVYTVDNRTIASGATPNFSISIAKDGYKPIAISACAVQNGTSSGANASNCTIYGWTFTSTTAYVNVKNWGSSSALVRIVCAILYVKNL